MSGPVEGLLLVDKPAGITSHDVVQLARRAYHEKSIGHLGTLDPFATGLLVLLLGRSTRLASFIVTDPKEYEATIRFGSETDTDDITGAETRSASPAALEAIEAAIPLLTGTIEQIPPSYSAKSVDGTRAYDAARKGAPLDLAPASVHVARWTLRSVRSMEIDVTIECGTGTYIRSLARDLGRLTGSAACLSALRRTRCGQFEVGSAIAVDAMLGSPPPLRTLSVVAADG